MKVLVQRVSRAEVRVEGAVVGRIEHGLLVLVGVVDGDGTKEARWMAVKTAHLRIFEDDAGRMNRSVLEAGGAALVVSQFTLADPEVAEPLVREYVEALRSEGVRVETGVFRAHMEVDSVNDGPVTLLLDPPAGQDR